MSTEPDDYYNPDVPNAPSFNRLFEKIFSTGVSQPVYNPSTDEELSADNFVSFFDQFPLPFPVAISFNPNEKEMCKTIGDVLRKYFSLGYRYGALDHFFGQVSVTRYSSNQFVLSRPGEPIPANPFQPFLPLQDNDVQPEATNDSRPQKTESYCS